MSSKAIAKAKAAMVAFLETGTKWQRLATSIPGVVVTFMPQSKDGVTPARLSMEVNPVDASGRATKKNGYFVRGKADVAPMADILTEGAYTPNVKVMALLDLIEEVNAEVNGTTPMPVAPVIEI